MTGDFIFGCFVGFVVSSAAYAIMIIYEVHYGD